MSIKYILYKLQCMYLPMLQALEIRTVPRQPPTVKTITSAEGEIIDMPKNVRARGPVEQWLCSVENGMFDTVKK